MSIKTKHLAEREGPGAVCQRFLSDMLNKTIVLVLNRNWQVINILMPANAFCQMATNAATALDIELRNAVRAETLRPVARNEWIALPIRERDYAVHTARAAIRAPTVIVAVNFAKVPRSDRNSAQ